MRGEAKIAEINKEKRKLDWDLINALSCGSLQRGRQEMTSAAADPLQEKNLRKTTAKSGRVMIKKSLPPAEATPSMTCLLSQDLFNTQFPFPASLHLEEPSTGASLCWSLTNAGLKLARCRDGAGATLFVGDLPPYYTNEDLYHVFANLGEIEDIRVMGSQCYAFVRFQDPATAEGLVHRFSRKPLIASGHELRINLAHGQLPDWKVGPVCFLCQVFGRSILMELVTSNEYVQLILSKDTTFPLRQ